MNTTKFLVSTLCLALLAACGGGSDSTPAAKPIVSSVTSDKLVYRQISTFTIKGSDLIGSEFRHLGCINLAEVGTGTSTERTYTCKIIRPGLVPVVVKDKSGNSVYSANQTIELALQPRVKMVTSMGDIELELNPAKAPITVDNFLNYTESNFYTNKIFHRVIKGFTIQGGGFTADLVEAPTQAPINNEVGNGLSNIRGSIAMARTNNLNSATSQFFINPVDNFTLDSSAGGYTVFGKVITGLDIVDLIQAVPTGPRGTMQDVPLTTITINSVTRTQ